MSPFILFIIYILISLINCDKLIFVTTHFRHGARAPMRVDQKYRDHIKEIWKSPGELTAVGHRMHYILGLRNRLRYITDTYNFLSERFNSHEILIYSSPFNRTLLSAYSQLQGLYPEFENLGEILYENQEKLAVPDIKYNYPSIEEKINKIKGNAMPNLMTLIPVRMINDDERKITLYDIGKCQEKRDEIKENNRKTLPIIINMEKEFNKEYGEKLNNFYGEERTYDYNFMNRLCDAVISGITDARNLTEFKKTKIDINKIKDYCFEVQKMNYREHILGDKEHILAPLEASKLMKEIIHYMKQRIDIDINQENIEEKFLDYSKPKMLMISGHDSTIACNEIFLLNCLNYSIKDFFRLPKYASQLALEIIRRDATIEEIKNMTYKDYIINYYFNDELILRISVDEFIKKIEPNLWTDQQIDDFCGFNNDGLNNIYLMIGIILSSLFIIFLISTIILSVKLFKMKKKHKEMVYQVSMVNRSSIND